MSTVKPLGIMRLDAAELRQHTQLNNIPWLVQALHLDDGAHREGRGYKVRCPAHGERSASCSLTEGPDGTLRIRCFACDLAGDIFDLVAAVRGLDRDRDFVRVLREVTELAGENYQAPARPALPPPPPPLDHDAFDQITRVLPAAVSVPDVARYLDGRCIIGEVGDDWRALPAGVEALAQLRDQVVRVVGLDVWERSGLAHVHRDDQDQYPCRPGCCLSWAWPSHRLVIPWRSAGVAGVVTTLQRRLIRAPLTKDEPRYVFPSGRRPAWPWGIEALELAGDGVEVAYVEGAIDAVALRILARRRARERVVLGLPGVSNWRPAWAELARGRVGLVALDPDPAGDDQANRIAQDLHQAGALRVLRTRPSTGKDWGERLQMDGVK